jgi:hypothetical protein
VAFDVWAKAAPNAVTCANMTNYYFNSNMMREVISISDTGLSLLQGNEVYYTEVQNYLLDKKMIGQMSFGFEKEAISTFSEAFYKPKKFGQAVAEGRTKGTMSLACLLAGRRTEAHDILSFNNDIMPQDKGVIYALDYIDQDRPDQALKVLRENFFPGQKTVQTPSLLQTVEKFMNDRGFLKIKRVYAIFDRLKNPNATPAPAPINESTAPATPAIKTPQ